MRKVTTIINSKCPLLKSNWYTISRNYHTEIAFQMVLNLDMILISQVRAGIKFVPAINLLRFLDIAVYGPGLAW